jgi:uncharacterized protein YacL
MVYRILWALFTGAWAVLGGILVGGLSDFYLRYEEVTSPPYSATAVQLIKWGFIFLGVLIGFLLGSGAYRKMLDLAAQIGRLSLYDQLVGVIGAIIGLALASLICVPLLGGGKLEAGLAVPIFIVVAIASVIAGVTWLRRLAAELVQQFPGMAKLVYQRGDTRPHHQPKLLDTSVVIDGRIRDICATGFLEGPLYVPSVVVSEVQRLADSSDELKRARGRRGLGTMEKLMDEFPHLVSLLEGGPSLGFEDQGVDRQLVAIAKNLGAEMLTNDINLARAAEVQGVRVLNINQLALSLRPEYVQGEEITLRLLRQGTEPGQGVGYLDDGTMVVVSNGADHIGQTVTVAVTTIYQTSAGRMVFAELKQPPPAARSERA